MNITPWYDLPPSTLALTTLDNATENYLGFPAFIGPNAGGRDVFLGVNYLNQGEKVYFYFYPNGYPAASAQLTNNGDANPVNWDLDTLGTLWNSFGIEPIVDTDVTPNLPAIHITANSISNPLPLPMVIAAYRHRNERPVLDNIMVLAESEAQIEDFLADVFIPLTVNGVGTYGIDGNQYMEFSEDVGRNQVASLGTILEEDLTAANVSKSGEFGIVLDNSDAGTKYEGTYSFIFA